MAAEILPIIKDETENVPACCRTCGNYRPKFFKVAHKECAVFGTIRGVKWERCGAWCRIITPPMKEGS